MSVRTSLFLACSLCIPIVAARAAAGHVTVLPPGTDRADPGAFTAGVPCDVTVRYDDGTDDQVNQGLTLGSDLRWTLGIVATPPAGASWMIQSASFFSEFVITSGDILVQVRDESIPAVLAVEQIFVDAPGIWEVEFSNPICVSGDFSVMLCPVLDFWGVCGEDTSDPDGRSYQVPELCAPKGNPPNSSLDLMIWACVTPCGAVPSEAATWGAVKSRYRAEHSLVP